MPRATASTLLCLWSVLAPGLAADPAFSVALKDAKGAPVADAVVSLAPLDDAAPPAAQDRPEIIQEDQQFAPFVTVVQTGAVVVFPNRDTVQHHVYSVSKARRFELPLYMPGKAEAVTFDEPGVVVLGCNIHDWMLAYLVVVPTPWFAISGKTGAATVAAPAGRYRLELWHPRLARPLTQDVAVAAGNAPLSFTLTLKPDRRIRRSPASKAGGYQ